MKYEFNDSRDTSLKAVDVSTSEILCFVAWTDPSTLIPKRILEEKERDKDETAKLYEGVGMMLLYPVYQQHDEADNKIVQKY